MIFGFRTKFYDLFLCKKRRSRFQAGLEFQSFRIKFNVDKLIQCRQGDVLERLMSPGCCRLFSVYLRISICHIVLIYSHVTRLVGTYMHMGVRGGYKGFDDRHCKFLD